MGAVEEGVKTNWETVNTICFADDQTMINESEEGIQQIMNTLHKTMENVDLK